MYENVHEKNMDDRSMAKHDGKLIALVSVGVLLLTLTWFVYRQLVARRGSGNGRDCEVAALEFAGAADGLFPPDHLIGPSPARPGKRRARYAHIAAGG